MTNIQLINLIISAKDKKKIIRILNKYRISIEKSKYC